MRRTLRIELLMFLFFSKRNSFPSVNPMVIPRLFARSPLSSAHDVTTSVAICPQHYYKTMGENIPCPA